MNGFDEALRILLVEDNRQDFISIRRALEKRRIPSRITLFDNSNQAFDRLLADAGAFDIAVITQRLNNGGSGLDLCHRLFEQEHPVPRILLAENEDLGHQLKKMRFITEYLPKDDSGQYLGVLPLIISEVVSQYREKSLQEQQKRALQAIENRFRTVLAHIADGIIIVDTTKKIRLANRAARELLDRKNGKLIGEPFDPPTVPGKTSEIEFHKKSGKRVILEMRAVEIDWWGETAYLASLRDITYRKQMSDALKTANQLRNQIISELKRSNTKVLEQQKAVIEEERLKVLLQMAGATAHELNQPLTVLLGSIELMGINRDDPEKVLSYVDRIEKAGKRISNIVKQIQTIQYDEASSAETAKPDYQIRFDQEAEILVVEESDADYENLEDILSPYPNARLNRAKNMSRALGKITTGSYDLILSEYLVPDGNAMDLLRYLREGNHSIPLVVITGQGDEMIASQLIQSGAFDYIPKNRVSDAPLIRIILNTLEKARLKKEIRKVHQRMAEMSVMDELTGLYNIRYFKSAINQEMARAKRYGTELVLCMFDLDHFKAVNDTYGHPVGDKILSRIGRMLREWIRKSDVACRYGGEEFVVILPHTDMENGRIMSDRFRKSVALHPFDCGSAKVPVSISMGLAGYPEASATNVKELIDQADQALYQAKASGRNQVVLFHPDIPRENKENKKLSAFDAIDDPGPANPDLTKKFQ